MSTVESHIVLSTTWSTYRPASRLIQSAFCNL
uniref:Uncharacterized protein n=1 Tax=Parascaris equorum TaxID=6256 RepID=A0A914RUY2_PAREQ